MSTVPQDSSYVEIVPGDLKNHPQCSHGPTLLFSRKTKGGDRKYYACSACRDRKLCHFFHWADEKFSSKRREMWEAEQKKFLGEKSHEEMSAALRALKPLVSKNQVAYCHACHELMLRDVTHLHSDHDVTLPVLLNHIMHPTELLKSLEHDKREAQYLFSKASVDALLSIALKNKIKSVVCIGTPRIHECIATSELNISSILLDIDKRYHMFYEADSFCWFNAFNNHFFFGPKSKLSFENFLRSNAGQRMLLILDPPFGGRLEPLAHTLRCIEDLCKQVKPHSGCDLAVILIYPYFMERHVTTCLPSLNMIDYKITYDNHPMFSQGTKARKLGSPVRMFTNISPEQVVLPAEEGYRFCELCQRWVSPENRHCALCQRCTSKNGSTYVHCAKCEKCVKPTWRHCQKCNHCCLKSHTCAFDRLVHKKHDHVDLKDNTIPVVNISNNNRKRRGETCRIKHKNKRNKKMNKCK